MVQEVLDVFQVKSCFGCRTIYPLSIIKLRLRNEMIELEKTLKEKQNEFDTIEKYEQAIEKERMRRGIHEDSPR